MPSVCFYFQVHQPLRVRRFTYFESSNGYDYFDDKKNREIIEKVSPGPRLEMYGRRPPVDSAWTVFGNQLTREKSP